MPKQVTGRPRQEARILKSFNLDKELLRSFKKIVKQKKLKYDHAAQEAIERFIEEDPAGYEVPEGDRKSNPFHLTIALCDKLDRYRAEKETTFSAICNKSLLHWMTTQGR